jgi:hypothetical protein
MRDIDRHRFNQTAPERGFYALRSCAKDAGMLPPLIATPAFRQATYPRALIGFCSTSDDNATHAREHVSIYTENGASS